MNQRRSNMVKSTCIAIILFSASVSFGQSSETKVKDVTSTNSTSKSGLGADTKSPKQEETIGQAPLLSLGTPTIEVNGTSIENPDQKKSTNGKNATKPH